MEVETSLVIAGLTLASSLGGCYAMLQGVIKDMAAVKEDMSKKMDSERHELHRKSQEDKCGMIHARANEVVNGIQRNIDQKFSEISEQIRGLKSDRKAENEAILDKIEALRGDRKDEIDAITALLRETLNHGGRKGN